MVACIFDAPIASAPSLILGGTAFIAARLEIIIVGKVINAKTNPPIKGIDLGIPNRLINIAKPSIPNTTEGTAARLLILISISSVNLFLGANSSR